MQYRTHLLRHLRYTIGRNIHAQRSEQKLPLRKLAKLTGVSEQLLGGISYFELIALAKVLDVSTAWLLFGDKGEKR